MKVFIMPVCRKCREKLRGYQLMSLVTAPEGREGQREGKEDLFEGCGLVFSMSESHFGEGVPVYSLSKHKSLETKAGATG